MYLLFTIVVCSDEVQQEKQKKKKKKDKDREKSEECVL